MVPGAGIEPARPLSRGILSPLRLPISPPGLDKAWHSTGVKASREELEAEGGIESPSTALQAIYLLWRTISYIMISHILTFFTVVCYYPLP